MRLLIADDSPECVDRLRGLIDAVSTAGGHADLVGRYEQAARRLEGERFDALLLSLDLPDGGGLRSLEQILKRHPELAVVALCDVQDDGFCEAAIAAGAQECLVRSRLDGVALDSVLRRAESRQRRALNASRDGMRRYRELFDLSRGLVCTHKLDGTLLSINPAAAEALGYPASELVGKNLLNFVSDRSRPVYLEHLSRYGQLDSDTGVMQVMTRNGQVRAWDYHNRIFRHAGQEPYVLGYAIDISERRLYERQLRELSQRDPLTGCFNRRYLVQYYGEPTQEQGWGVVVAELDQFRAINERLGHQRGDEILSEMARFLGYHARRSDVLVRMGGDQFLLLLPNADVETTEAVAARIRGEAASDAPCSFGLGYGVREHGEPLERTIDRAEREVGKVEVALREAERRGRG